MSVKETLKIFGIPVKTSFSCGQYKFETDHDFAGQIIQKKTDVELYILDPNSVGIKIGGEKEIVKKGEDIGKLHTKSKFPGIVRTISWAPGGGK